MRLEPMTATSFLQLSIFLLPHVGARVLTTRNDVLNSDNFTAFGSAFDNGTDDRPVTTVGIGFNYCGLEFLDKVLGKHPGAIMSRTPSTEYFLPEGNGSCRPSPNTVGQTPHQRFVKDCFKGRVAGPGETYVDITGDYAPFAMDGVADRLKEMANETALRFVAVVCDPRVRAIASVKRHLRAENKRAGGKFLDERVLDAMHRHQTEGFDGSIAVGEYATMLEAWLEIFPRESLLVVNTLGLKDPETWKRIFSHIGLSMPDEDDFDDWTEGLLLNDHALFKHSGVQVKKQLNEHFGERDVKLWQLLNSTFW